MGACVLEGVKRKDRACTRTVNLTFACDSSNAFTLNNVSG